MPSHEDYLDRLLRSMTAGPSKETEESEVIAAEPEQETADIEYADPDQVSETVLPESDLINFDEEAREPEAAITDITETEEKDRTAEDLTAAAEDYDALEANSEETAGSIDITVDPGEAETDYDMSATDLTKAADNIDASADLDEAAPDYNASAADFTEAVEDIDTSAPDYDGLAADFTEAVEDIDTSAPDYDGLAADFSEAVENTDMSADLDESALDYDALAADFAKAADSMDTSADLDEAAADYDSLAADFSETVEDMDTPADSGEAAAGHDSSAVSLEAVEDTAAAADLEEGAGYDASAADSGEAGPAADLDLTSEAGDADLPSEDLEASTVEDILADVSAEEDLPQAASDMETVASMPEENIESLLSAEAEASPVAEKGPEEEFDVLKMLEEIEKRDILEINDLPDREDNNEAAEAEADALLQEAPAEENHEAEELLSEPDLSKKEAKALKKQEKAAARKAAKEAKAAAKAAAKEAKAAAKAAKNGEEVSVSSDGPTPVENTQSKEVIPNMGEEELFDASVLDSIVSEAELKGSGDSSEPTGGEQPEGILDSPDPVKEKDGETLGDSGGTDNGADVSDNTAGDMGFDMGSLFGDDADSGLGSDEPIMIDPEDFPDFVDIEDRTDKLAADEEDGKKEKGLLAKIFDFLTEEDEKEDSNSLKLSDENREALNDLDKEKAKKKSKKKEKKSAAKGDKKGAKGKGKKAQKPKKPKKPKADKPKKEKEPELEPLIPERKLTIKRVLPVILICASLAVLIIVSINASVDFTEKQSAREAYLSGDYRTCYQNYFGKELNESEQNMFGTSQSMLYVQLWLKEYEMLAEAGEELEALDSLIQMVVDYPKLYDYAVQWNAGDEVLNGYQHILNILAEKYGLTEAQALEIANARSDIEYTRMVLYIVEGRPFGSWDTKKTNTVVSVPEIPAPPEPLPDELPEEEELGEELFIEN